MKCPKCGSDNPDGTIFCEKCDWQLSKKYRGGKSPNKITILMYVSIVVGLASLITSLLKFGIFGAVCGGIGMVASGYTMTVARVIDFEPKTKKIMLAISIIALAASVIGFILGLTNLQL